MITKDDKDRSLRIYAADVFLEDTLMLLKWFMEQNNIDEKELVKALHWKPKYALQVLRLKIPPTFEFLISLSLALNVNLCSVLVNRASDEIYPSQALKIVKNTLHLNKK